MTSGVLQDDRRDGIYDDPKCRTAFEGFGALPDDRALVAEVDGEVVGAC